MARSRRPAPTDNTNRSVITSIIVLKTPTTFTPRAVPPITPTRPTDHPKPRHD